MRKLWGLFQVFFKLGCFSFGGSAAYMAMMHKRVVRDMRWMDDRTFMDLLSWTTLIPGANSTQMAIQCGFQKGGAWGYVLSGLAFIIPTSVITMLLAWGYTQFAGYELFNSVFMGFRAIILGILLSVLINLAKSSVKNWKLAAIGAMIFITIRIGVSPVAALVISGLMGILWFSVLNRYSLGSVAPFVGVRSIASAAAIGKSSILINFLKMGLILFGSEYVLVGHLQEIVVRQLSWVTYNELWDAVALSQFVPGPVISIAGFVGFQAGGPWGGVLAIVAVFIPSFAMVGLYNYLRPKIEGNQVFIDFMDSVKVGAVAVMAVVCLQLGKWTMGNWRTIAISLIGIFLVFIFKRLNVFLIVIVGGLSGAILYLI